MHLVNKSILEKGEFMNWINKACNNRKARKKKLIEQKIIEKKWIFILDIVEVILPITMVVFCMGAVVYLLFQIHIDGMETILDFIVAYMSGMLLVVSLINKHLSDKLEYMMQGAILFGVCSIGLIIMGIALVQRGGSVARIISIVSLIISAVEEIKEYAKFQFRYVLDRNECKKNEIKQLENSSVFDEKFDTVNKSKNL